MLVASNYYRTFLSVPLRDILRHVTDGSDDPRFMSLDHSWPESFVCLLL